MRKSKEVASASGISLPQILDWLETTPFPESTYGSKCLAQLKQVKGIYFDERAQTAQIEKQRGRGKVIYINRSFYEEYLRPDRERSLANLAFVLLHEAAHALRADFSRRVVGLKNLHWRRLSNLLTDLFVNAALYQNGFPVEEDLTRQLYEPEGLNFLLLPPHHLCEKFLEKTEGRQPKIFSQDIYESSESLLTAIFEATGKDEQDSWSEAKPTNVIPGEMTQPVPSNQLGNVDPESMEDHRKWVAGQARNDGGAVGFGCEVGKWLYDQIEEQVDWIDPECAREHFKRLFRAYLQSWTGGMILPELARLLDEILLSTPRFVMLGGHGRRGQKGRGDGEGHELTTRPRKEQRVARFVQIIKRALDEDCRSLRPVRAQQKRPGVVPAHDRRSSYLLGRGTWPVFFKREAVTREREGQATHVYLDSSGSMSDEIVDMVASLILGSEELIAGPVYLFTTKVKPVRVQELKQGHRLTGGTKINCVLSHARENKFKRILVISDGHVEDLTQANQNYLKKAQMFVCFEREARPRLDQHATDSWENLESYLTGKKVARYY